MTPPYALRSFFLSLSLKSVQGDDLKAPTTRINLALPPPSTAEVPRKITEEERGFEAAKTLRDAKFRARHEGQRRLRAAKVIPSDGPGPPLPQALTAFLLQREEEEANKKK